MTSNFHILGARGTLGNSLVNYFKSKNIPHTSDQNNKIDLTFPHEVDRYFENLTSGTIINCAALMPADRCELEPEKSIAVNLSSVLYLYEKLVLRRNFRLITFSSDFVFNGLNSSPYDEFQFGSPLSTYGRHKFLIEQLARVDNSNRIRVIRFSSLVTFDVKQKSFLSKIVEKSKHQSHLNVVSDLTISVTTPIMIFDAILKCFDLNNSIINVSSKDHTTWYELASYVFERLGIECEVLPVSSANFPSIASRPIYSVLEPSPQLKLNYDSSWRSLVNSEISEFKYDIKHS